MAQEACDTDDISPNYSRGRPEKDFDSSSSRMKKRKSDTLRTEKSLNELLHAAMLQLKEEGRLKDAADSQRTKPFLFIF